AIACPRARRLAAALGRPGRIASAHRPAAFAPSARPDMRLALALLLGGLAARFLALGPGQMPLVLAFAVVFRRARLAERDGDGLPAALHLATLAAAAALELAVLELVHHTAGGLSLTGRCTRHGGPLTTLAGSHAPPTQNARPGAGFRAPALN